MTEQCAPDSCVEKLHNNQTARRKTATTLMATARREGGGFPDQIVSVLRQNQGQGLNITTLKPAEHKSKIESKRVTQSRLR